MPVIPDDSGQTMALLMQVTQMNNARKAEQIRNLLETAHSGETVKDLGIDEPTFHRIYGNRIPYDPNKMIKDQTANDLMDKNVQKYITGLSPQMAMDLAASFARTKTGVAGLTTAAGVAGEMKAGGIAGQIAGDVATATQPTVTSTAVTRANTDATKAQTEGVQATSGLGTAKEIADRINAGMASMRKAPTTSQDALNQRLAFGITSSGLNSQEAENQLKIATVKEALAAQVNPSHPMNAFLAKNGLDIHTAMGAAAMGMGQLLDTYAHGLMQLRVGNKEADNILLKMSTDTAKEMSEKVFQGKLTPGQVLTLMRANETGAPIPKGYEGADALMKQATNANYQAAVTKSLMDGDPEAIAAKQMIDNMGKLGNNPRQLEAANQIERLSTAKVLTKFQTGVSRPNDPEKAKAWDQIYQANLDRIVGAKVHVNWLIPNQYEVTGAPGSGAPAPNPNMGILGSPIGGSAPKTSPLLSPVGGTPPGAVPSPIPGTQSSSFTPEQSQAISDWLKVYAGQQGGAQAPSNPAPAVPPAGVP